MRLSLHILGLHIIEFEWTTDSPTPEPDDPERDLSGGDLYTTRIDTGPTDCYLGFTNGRGEDG